MECKKVEELLSEYIDGILPVEDTADVRDHLASCERCRETWQSMVSIIEIMGGMEELDPPAGFLGRVSDRLDGDSPVKRTIRRIFSPWQVKIPLELAGVAAAAVLIVYVSGFLGRKGIEEIAPKGIGVERSVGGEDERVKKSGRSGKAGEAGEENGSQVRADYSVDGKRYGKGKDEAVGGKEKGLPDLAGKVRKETDSDAFTPEEKREQEVAGIPEADRMSPVEQSGKTASRQASTEKAGSPQTLSGKTISPEESTGKNIGKAGGPDDKGAVLTFNPPSDSYDSTLSSGSVLRKELERFVLSLGGRIVTGEKDEIRSIAAARSQEKTAVRFQDGRPSSDMYEIRPLRTLIPAVSWPGYLDRLRELEKERRVKHTILVHSEDSLTVLVEFD